MEYGQAKEIEKNMPPEFLDRKGRKDSAGRPQLAIATVEDPQINRDAARGDPYSPARRGKDEKTERYGDQDIAPPRRRRAARAEQAEDSVPRHVLKNADCAQFRSPYLSRDGMYLPYEWK